MPPEISGGIFSLQSTGGVNTMDSHAALSTLCYMEKDGKYLMLHRTVKKHDVNKDKWIGVGGHFEAEESPEECLLREVREETGMTVSHMKFNRTQFFEKSDTLMCNFTAFVKDSSELHTNYEVDKYAWFTRDEARGNIRPNSLAEKFLVAYLDETEKEANNE